MSEAFGRISERDVHEHRRDSPRGGVEVLIRDGDRVAIDGHPLEHCPRLRDGDDGDKRRA